MITIPFDVEVAKKIQAKEMKGRIIQRDMTNVTNIQIIYWNKFGNYPIVALITNVANMDMILTYTVNGHPLNPKGNNNYDLLLEVPAYTQFKENDIVTNGYKIYILGKKKDAISTDIKLCKINNALSYSSYIHTEDLENFRKVTSREKEELIEFLKSIRSTKSSIILQEVFNIELFKPFDKVLVRRNLNDYWKPTLFSHRDDDNFYAISLHAFRYCIPYNEETKHLVGTNNPYPNE